MTKVGVVGIRGAWSTERLLDAFEQKTGFRCLIDMETARLDLPERRIIAGGMDLRELDGIAIKKIGETYSTDLLDRLDMLRLLSETGVPIFSNPESIMRVINRLSCTVTLQAAGIPMPPTAITESPEHAVEAVTQFCGAVLKPLFSTKARGMRLVHPSDDVQTAIREFKKANPVMYIQKLLDIPGKDLGVVFVGGEYLTTYARVKSSDAWTTSTAFGGKYEPYAPSKEIIALARKAQSAFNLDFTCVDVVESSEGPMVFEVSAFGGFRGIQMTGNIDAAAVFADYVLGSIGKGGPHAV